jgi:hypothetical protein
MKWSFDVNANRVANFICFFKFIVFILKINIV